MNVEVIKNLKVSTSFCEIRAGKALTILEIINNGKPTGRDFVFKNEKELDELIEGLNKVKEFLENEKTR